MKPFFIALCALIQMIVAQPAAAEFYRYVDKHGNVLYTDDLNKIPADQRVGATAYADAPPDQPEPPAQEPEDTPDSVRVAGETDTIIKERQALKELGDTLNQEYEQLAAERILLDQEKENAVTNDQIEEYNHKIVDFNERIQDYENRRDAYAAQVREFNDRAAAATATPPDP